MISIFRLENELNINLNIFKKIENLINFFKLYLLGIFIITIYILYHIIPMFLFK